MATLTATIGGVPVAVAMDQASMSRKIGERSTCTLLVTDLTNAYTLTQNQSVVVTDSVLGTQFTGVVEKVEDVRLPGSSTVSGKAVVCKDARYYADKRQMVTPDYTNMRAGDILCDLHSKYLAAEGIVANYAIDRDTDATTLGAGTLVNTSAASGVLTLAPSGTDYVMLETTTADFAAGTLVGVVAASNALTLTTNTCLELSGTYQGSGGSGPQIYAQTWFGSVACAAGDTLRYDIFIPSSNPELTGGIDLKFSDSTTLRSVGTYDSLGYTIDPLVALPVAVDTWYSRVVPMDNGMQSKTVTLINYVITGTKPGDYQLFFKNVGLYNAAGTLKQAFFSGTLTSYGMTQSGGYRNGSLILTSAYTDTGTRVSSAYSIASAGIVKSSAISWTMGTYVQPTTATVQAHAPIEVESSVDGGATWQMCTNNGPIPNLTPGMNTASTTITLRERVSISGPNPKIAPQLLNCEIFVNAAPACTKTDVVDTDSGSSAMTTGTLTNMEYAAPGLRITGKYRNFDDGDMSSQTLFGGGTAPTASIVDGGYKLWADNTFDARSRLDFATNTWQDFIAEVDVFYIDNNSFPGLVYRTTFWGNANGTYAYAAYLGNGFVVLNRGTNNATGGTPTSLGNSSYGFTNNTWYTLKVEVSGSTHKVYVNGALALNVTDATFSAAGYIGLRHYNVASGARRATYFDNFGVMSNAFTATRVSPSLSLTSVTTSIQTSAIFWNEVDASNATVLVETSINGGSTYLPCTNGGEIPNLTFGLSTSGLALLVRITLTTNNASATPYVTGLTVRVVGKYLASGTRVSPALSLTPAGTVGDSSVSWETVTPPGATIVVAASVNGDGNWATVATSGDQVFWLTKAYPTAIDDYVVSSAGNYTAANYSAGTSPTLTFDTANSRVKISGGVRGMVPWNTPGLSGFGMVSVTAIIGQCDNFGLYAGQDTTSNFFSLLINDASVAVNPNTVRLLRRYGGTDSTLVASTALPLTMTRGGYYSITFSISGTTLTASINGLPLFSPVTDTSGVWGKVGFRQDANTVESHVYVLRADSIGENVATQTLQTRLTLTTTAPAGPYPIVRSITACVRSPDIAGGPIIPTTAFQYQGDVGKAIDFLATASQYWSRINESKKLLFQPKTGYLAPFPLTTISGSIDGVTAPKLVHYSPKYRNRQYVAGAFDVVTITDEPHKGDGVTQAWPLSNPVFSVSAVRVDATTATVGIGGLDTGKDYYYRYQSSVFSQDNAGTPLSPDQTVYVTYLAIIDYVAMKESTAQQTMLAALEGGTGIVEDLEQGAGMDKATADALAQSRIDQYAILGRQWGFTTYQSGLQPGQLLYVFVPEHTLNDVPMLITDIATHYTMQGVNAVPVYDVTCVEGPNIGSWAQFFSTL